MKDKENRWKQRFNNFSKPLSQLKKFIDKGELNEFEIQGIIQAFEYTYELAWNTVKDFYENQGETGIQGSRDTIRLAFNRGMIKDGDGWMEMLKDRNRTVHTYNEELAADIQQSIINKYFRLFTELKMSMEKFL